jgi:tetratricopeptide (TPR) repeat protein
MNLNQLVDSAYDLFNHKKYNDSLEALSHIDEVLQNENLTETEKSAVLVSLLNLKGFNFLGLNSLDRATEMYASALEVNPNSSQACAGLGEVFHMQFKEEEAKTMFEWAIKNNPGNLFAVSGLAKANRDLGLEENHNNLILN